MTLVTRDTRLINTETGEYPVYLQELSSKIPNACFPSSIDSEALVDFNYVPVMEVEAPQGDVVTEGDPVLEDGVYKRNWIVRVYSPQEYNALLQQKKETTLYNIEQLRVAQFKIGFPHLFGENADLYHVQVRDTDRVNILSYRTLAKEALAEGTADQFSVEFRVYENVSVHLDAQAMVDMANASAVQVLAGYKVIWELKLATEQATSFEDIPALPETIFSL